MRDPALWQRIRTHPIVLTSGPFDEALAGLTNLSGKRATVAVEEYRRFIYLIATTNEHLAPSPAIDAVWHRHLGDWRAYTTLFCLPVVGAIVPYRPSDTDAGKNPDYLRTLFFYKEEFGSDAPLRIWPLPVVLRADIWFRIALVVGLILCLLWVLQPVPVLIGLGGLVLFIGGAAFLVLLAPWSVWKDAGGGAANSGWSGGIDGGGGN